MRGGQGEVKMKDELPRAIRVYLSGFVWQRRWFALVRAGGLALSVGLGWMLASCLADRLLRLSGSVRMGLLVAGLVVVIAIVGRPFCRMFWWRVDWRGAAEGVEKGKGEFADRLKTVVSQWMEEGAYRGSSAMLWKLREEVEGIIEGDRGRRWVRWGEARSVWGMGVLLGLLAVVLALVPGVGMPRLIRRLSQPLAAIAPVTRTRVVVEPGDIDVVMGKPLTIRAKVERLEVGGVDVFTSTDGVAWSRIAMLPVGENEYVFSLRALDRDVHYYVEAGDATTARYRATVLRPPGVVGYRIRYEYPKYTGRSGPGVLSTEGLVEAVVGTRVVLQVESTEELRGAALKLNGREVVLTKTEEAKVWRGEFVVEKSGTADLRMVSGGG